jgi:hypothetical protein
MPLRVTGLIDGLSILAPTYMLTVVTFFFAVGAEGSSGVHGVRVKKGMFSLSYNIRRFLVEQGVHKTTFFSTFLADHCIQCFFAILAF